MFQTVTQTVQAPEQYQINLLEIYRKLVNGQGKINGLTSVHNNNQDPGDLKTIIGIKPLIRYFSGLNNAFGFYEMSIENMVAKGGKVMVKYTISGIQKAKFMGYSPSLNIVKISGMDIFRVDNSRVVEYWNVNHIYTGDR